MDYNLLNCPPFPADEDKMINSTRIRVARNLAAYPLGTAITREQRKEVEGLVVSALNEFTGDLKGKYFSLDTMTEADKKQLIADHFLFKGGDKYLQSAGLERDWPEARGIFHNDAKTFLSGLMRRINLESFPCKRVPTSSKFSKDSLMLPTKSNPRLNSLMMIISVTSLLAQPIWELVLEPLSISTCQN